MSRIPAWTNVLLLALRFVLFAGVAVCAQLAGPAWADAYTDVQAALGAASATTTPLIVIPAALTNLAPTAQLGNGVVHWGEYWTKSNFNVLNKSQLGMLDKTSGSYDAWAKYRTEGRLLFNTTWKSGVGKDIYDEANPTRRFPASAPASGNYENGFEQFIPSGVLQWPDLAAKYDVFKDFALQSSRYYTTDAAGSIYKGPVKDLAHQVIFSTEFGEADRVNSPYDFVFIDTIDGNPPAADGSNLATVSNSATGIGMKGIFYICANFDQTGAGNPATLPNAQKPDGSVVSLAKVYLDGVMYVSGTTHFGGNPVIYGSVVSEKGFLSGGTPDVYYNHSLATGMNLPSYFRLTFEAGPGGSVSADDGLTTAGSLEQTVREGDDATAVSAMADTGYHFTEWLRSGDGATTTSNPLTLKSAAEDTTLTATFAINTYTLTYTAGANGSISGTTPQIVNYGASGTAVEAVPDTGYHFLQWNDSSAMTPRTDTNVTTDIAVTAAFEINTYTLTYTAGANGSISGTTPQTVNYGASGTAVEAVPDAGYHFLQWNDSSAMTPRTDTNVTTDVAVRANFAINTYTLTYTAGANGSISGASPQTVDYGANGTEVTAVPNPGYHFVNWDDAHMANPRADTNVMMNITVTANFAINLHSVTFQTDGTDGAMLDGLTSQTVAHGTDATTVTAIAPMSHHFVKWTVDGEDFATSNPLILKNVAGDISVTANFAITTYTLTYTAWANGSISGTTPQIVNYGASGTPVEAVPDIGYHFLQWNDSSAMTPRTDTNVTTDVAVAAAFEINTYTLSYTAGANGSIRGTTPQSVNYGASGTPVEAVPEIGYHFLQWNDSSAMTPRTDTNVTTDVAATATFAINTYTLTYNAGAGGSISGATPQTVASGADGAEVTAVPNTGYRFARWSDGVMTASRTDTNVTADINVTAIFAPPAAVKDWSLYE